MALYLAALASQAGDRGDGEARVRADGVLARTSVLDQLTGALCDAVTRTHGSAELLESLARSNLLVVPLDRRGEWYRYHRLLRGLLRSELDRREPRTVPRLHALAAAWYLANDRSEAAIAHAQAAGDADQVAHLVAQAAFPAYVPRAVGRGRRPPDPAGGAGHPPGQARPRESARHGRPSAGQARGDGPGHRRSVVADRCRAAPPAVASSRSEAIDKVHEVGLLNDLTGFIRCGR